EKGLGFFEKVVETAEPGKRVVAKEDWGIAKAAWLHFASVANQVQFVMARDSIQNNRLSPAEKRILITEINNILNNEIMLAKALFEITRSDSRIGYEASNQYYYVPHDLIEKVINCEFIRSRLGSM